VISSRSSIIVLVALIIFLSSCNIVDREFMKNYEKDRVINAADIYLKEFPITVTAFSSPRSAGDIHDFFSEGDYWWPDPENPGGKYIRRDGQSNPDNFDWHRKAMIRLSLHVPTLTSAYILTEDQAYAEKALEHLRAWFVNESTMMSPHLKYAQAISGRVSGRGVGIIDTIHLIEVARSAKLLYEMGAIPKKDYIAIQEWFEKYLTFMTEHEYGIDERDRLNNHGSCWDLQVAVFADLSGNEELIEYAKDRVKTVLLPAQLAEDGSFPKELARTKPYGYSLFNMEIMGTLAHFLSTEDDNLWTYKVENGASLETAINYILPYIQDKSSWPYDPDVMYYDLLPVRYNFLLFAVPGLEHKETLKEWKKLDADPVSREMIRNMPIRQPLLWMQ
jgi:Alginate lyase